MSQSETNLPTAPEPDRSTLPGMRVIPLSLLLCLTQSLITIYAENIHSTFLTSSMISVSAFACLALFVLAINPMLSRIRWIRIFNRAELVCVYAALIMTAGLSTFGMSNQLVPLIHAPWNPEWNTEQRGWSEKLTNQEDPLLNPRLFLRDESAIRDFRQGVPVTKPVDDAGWNEQLSYHMDVAKAIPWNLWAGPLTSWLIFYGAFFGLFYSLSYVVLGYWSDREKLIFPLARMAEFFLPTESETGTSKGRVPPVFREPFFWAGLGVAAFLLSWNAAVSAGWIAESFKIPLGMSWSDFGALVERTFLAPLGNEPGGEPAGSLTLRISLLAIGIGFLLPVHVSFSSWFYFVIGQFVILGAVWFGFGEHFKDFAGANNIVGSQGAGALLFFSVLSLGRCVLEYLRLIRGKPLRERMLLLLPVTLMVVFQLILVSWLQWNNVPIVWGALFILFSTVLSLGLMRIVAEAGIYYFGSSLSFLGFTGTFGLRGWIGPEVMAKLAPIHSMLFFDLKAFMAPNFLTAAKLQKDNVKGRKWVFHLNAILCLLVCMIVAVLATVFLAHERGAQQMYSWFYSGMPQRVLDSAQELLSDKSGFAPVNATWFAVGAAWVAFSLWTRQRIFWFPHPIGYILWANGFMSTLWFSFLIGWFVKALVVRYGGKRTFDKVLPFFLGLIAGELLIAFLWTLVGLAVGFESGLLPG